MNISVSFVLSLIAFTSVMYSLYRAWLSLGPIQAPPPPPPPPPSNLSGGAPDVALQVGPGHVHFSAHRAVLSAHSGFFKAALLNRTEPTPIAVPNVNVDEFSSLLTFMYTGYLDLDLSNIYNILLATHMLHMPRALEICRSFLLQTQTCTANTIEQSLPVTTTRTSIIKPIASRKAVLPTQQFYTPNLTTNQLKKSEATPFKTVTASSTTSVPPTPPPPPPPPQIEPSTSSDVTSPTQEDDTVDVVARKSDSTKTRRKRSSLQNPVASGNGDDHVIIDIACCDGPVRFHRVINKMYGQQEQTENFVEINEINNRNVAMNKAMHDSIRQMSDENTTGNEMFTCLYCNHAFKSQYCYQKHAQRHINPVSVEITKQNKNPTTTVTTPTVATTTNRREVKLLDMNVQYYPCKTCGSKFPSYYFVHKHRKMCHADEMTGDSGGGANATESQNDDVPPTPNLH